MAKKNSNEAQLAEEYVIRGIFDVGYADFNSSIIVTSLENGQQLYQLGEGVIHGLQIKLTDPFKSDAVAGQLRAKLTGDLRVKTWQQQDPALFNALGCRCIK